MQRNMGTLDRGARGLVGITLLLFFFLAPSSNVIVHWGELVLGVVLVGTGALGWCPPYQIFGINTCSAEDNTD